MFSFPSSHPPNSFTKTNQTAFLDAPAASLPSILAGMRQICEISSTLIGNASEVDGEVSSSSAAPAPTVSASAAISTRARETFWSFYGVIAMTMALGGGILCL